VAQYLPQILDAILAKVEMSMVTSMPNISKNCRGIPGSLQQIFSLDICLDFFAKITKIEPWEFQIFSLKVVNRLGLESSRCHDMTNFNHRKQVKK
jgi:hypothetical protein